MYWNFFASRRRRDSGLRPAARRAFLPEPAALEPRQLLSAVDVLTYHNDIARDGLNSSETILAPANVNPLTFGKLFSYPVDGAVFAQPLFKAKVPIAGGLHNVAFVATTHDSVYAFDADSNLANGGNPYWRVSFTNPDAGITSVPGSDFNSTVLKEIGIIGTPVIDPSSGTLYVVAATKDVVNGTTTYVHKLHALDIGNGAEKFGGPVTIQASIAGVGDGSNTDTFHSESQLQRSGLLLLNGVVYIAWSSHDDNPPYHGWVLGYNAQTLQQVSVFNPTPDGTQGAIWMSGGAPAADGKGNIYVITGNGNFDAQFGGRNLGDSVIKLSTKGGKLTAIDYFTPSDQQTLNDVDMDLGSGGVVLLPEQGGATPRLLVGAGKEGKVYVVNRDQLGHFNPKSDPVVQESAANVVGPPGADPSTQGNFSTPAFYNNKLFAAGLHDSLKSFLLTNGKFSFTPASESSNKFGYPGATPSISANQTRSGIVWALEKGAPGSAVLHAYSASNLANELYNSSMAGARDQLDRGTTFAVPTVANGKVYVGTQTNFTVFGNLPALPPAVTPANQVQGSSHQGGRIVRSHHASGGGNSAFAHHSPQPTNHPHHQGNPTSSTVKFVLGGLPFRGKYG